jgi:hypothetical protein
MSAVLAIDDTDGLYFMVVGGETIKVRLYQDCMGGWHAAEDEYDEGRPVGHGDTLEAAYADLKEMLWDELDGDETWDVEIPTWRAQV